MKKSTTEEFIKKVILVHENKYDYSKVVYTNNSTKVIIICPEHGEFKQTPDNHLTGKGCPKCVGKNITTEEFIRKAILVHGNKYDYSKVVYVKSKIKVIIICPEHGEFKQTPDNHLRGKKGCPNCGNKRRNKTKSYSNEEFIRKAILVHGNKYDYSKVVYVNYLTKVIIICPEHGEFEQIPLNHLKGKGCSKCKESKGEKMIRDFLENNNIKYEKEYPIKIKTRKKRLKCDFYLNEKSIVIEFHGDQHFKPVEFFGGEKELKNVIKRDKEKYNYCLENGIKYIQLRNYHIQSEEKLNFTLNFYLKLNKINYKYYELL